VGRERGAEHYDSNLELVSLPLWRSPWLAVYATAAELLATGAGPIADVGCGTGRLARLLYERGERDYLGIDFSSARIEEARRYAPGMRFDVGDVHDPAVRAWIGAFARFAILETLEHIEDDLGLLEAIPPGSLVVFSVPNYDSAAHVRWFDSPRAVGDRYGGLIDVDPAHAAVLPLARRPEKRIFVLAGRRR
jgi:2-polyprenyl-3-methyl-5-hydroxy-6-metoxy-1,4-benzoquinol methylase